MDGDEKAGKYEHGQDDFTQAKYHRQSPRA